MKKIFNLKILLLIAFIALLIVAIPRFFGGQKESDITSKPSAEGGKAFKKGNFKEAIKRLNKAIEADPSSADDYRMLGKSYEATGKLDEALKAYRNSLSIDQKQHEVHYSIGIIYHTKGQNEAAVAQLEKAIEINEDFIGAKLMLADIYAETDQKDKAIKLYQSVIDDKPTGVDIQAIHKKLNDL